MSGPLARRAHDDHPGVALGGKGEQRPRPGASGRSIALDGHTRLGWPAAAPGPPIGARAPRARARASRALVADAAEGRLDRVGDRASELAELDRQPGRSPAPAEPSTPTTITRLTVAAGGRVGQVGPARRGSTASNGFRAEEASRGRPAARGRAARPRAAVKPDPDHERDAHAEHRLTRVRVLGVGQVDRRLHEQEAEDHRADERADADEQEVLHRLAQLAPVEDHARDARSARSRRRSSARAPRACRRGSSRTGR